MAENQIYRTCNVFYAYEFMCFPFYRTTDAYPGMGRLSFKRYPTNRHLTEYPTTGSGKSRETHQQTSQPANGNDRYGL